VGNHTTEINNLKTLLGATADTTSVINLSNALVDSITNVRDEAAANLNKAYEFAKQAAADSANQVKVDLTNSISEVKEDLKETIKNNADSIDHLADSIKANAVKIAKLQDALTDLTNVVANVQKDLSNLITGILIQGTDDPIFGYLALPFGIQTNILAAYYGAQWSDDDLSFPTVGSLNYISDDYFTAEDAALVGFNAETIISTDATIMNTNVGNAGKIYLTINPSTIDFTGQTLILESSAGNASPIQLSNIKKSDKELTFGYTRAGNNNGFYEADATLLSEGIASAKPNIQLSTFKTLAKDILNTKTFNLTNIVSTVYQSINGVLPRYGAKATWTNSEDKEVAVLSQYSIATTAIKPLSYSFLKDVNLGSSYLNKRLPLIDENAISNKIDDAVGNISFNFNIDTIKINVPDLTFNIKWEGIEFSQDGLQLEVSYEYKLPQYEYDEVNKELVTLPDSTKHTGTAYVDNIDDLYDKIETEVNDKVGALVDSISTFNGKIENFTSEINGIQESINTVLKSINGQLDTNVQDAIDQIKDNLNGLGSGYISTYNNVATRINSVLNRVTSAISNANSKLQPTMIYDAADGTSMQLSAAKAMPTVFNVSGSGEQVAELLATSYSAELLAPAYKKYVAVTNVYKDGKSAKDGDATCKAALAKANNPERFMNTVIDGTQRQVLLTTDSQYKGYTYEIAYAAVDYFGQISLRRYYVKVK
jgi:TolA-binding protein